MYNSPGTIAGTGTLALTGAADPILAIIFAATAIAVGSLLMLRKRMIANADAS